MTEDDRPPMPFVMRDQQPAAVDEPPLKPDWKDFVALVLAAYQVLFLPLLAIVGGIIIVYLVLSRLFH